MKSDRYCGKLNNISTVIYSNSAKTSRANFSWHINKRKHASHIVARTWITR